MSTLLDGVADRRSILLAGALLVLVQAVVLAAVAIPAPHTGGDNAAYLALGHALADGVGYVELWDPDVPPHTKYPPVYPAVLALLMLAGASTWATFKLASAVALSGATLAAFAWSAERRGALAAGGIALLLVLSGGWQEASRWILSEPWFLLWTYLAFWSSDRALRPAGSASPDGRRGERTWTMVAVGAALLAFGVRSAGLPVVIAVVGGFLFARRARAAGVAGALSALIVGAWLWRGSGGGEGAYQEEFWLRNPYDPALGTVGPVGMLERVWENLRLYVVEVLPAEWWAGAGTAAATVLGLLVVGLALGGWAMRLRPRPGVPELFLPLYAGMILVWPEVWSGDRFLLPLLPLLLLYSGEAVAALVRAGASRYGPQGRAMGSGEGSVQGSGRGSAEESAQASAKRSGKGRAVRRARESARGRGMGSAGLAAAVLAAGFLALALPALSPTFERAGVAGDCRAIVDASDDAMACLGPGVAEFREAAAWMGANLPADAAVLSRKPRMLYALGGPRGRTFPFTREPESFLEEAERLGADYVLVDRWDGLASQYVVPVISNAAGAFCYAAGWGADPGSAGTSLFGILPPEERRSGVDPSAIERCRAVAAGEGASGDVSGDVRAVRAGGTRVPLLARP